MTMNLPPITGEYAWQIESHLHTEELSRGEVRVTIVRLRPHALMWRRRPVYSKTITIKNSAKRDEKIEKTARKLWNKFQATAYEQNMVAVARYNAHEEISRAHAHIDTNF